ncbi:MAG: Na+/H+ antiporter NhaA [Campylobacterales bacterium]
MSTPIREASRPSERIFFTAAQFIRSESFGGILLFSMAVLAMIIANSALAHYYFELWHMEFGLAIGSYSLTMSLHHWINDGLMALFFLLVGLEIKRELLVGELSSPRKAAFPMVAALGGMVVPASIFLAFTAGTPYTSGFGVPMATDIAFALGVLMLLGKRVPLPLKIFLTSLAVADDLGAIIVIALFYTADLNLGALLLAVAVIAGLLGMNRMGVKSMGWYLLLGLVLWFAVHESGIHATIAGVALAMTIPVHSKITSQEFLKHLDRHLEHFSEEEKQRKNVFLTQRQQHIIEEIGSSYTSVQNPLTKLEHALHPLSSFLIMPLFAFANAGVALGGVEQSVWHPVAFGVVLGLLVGKPVGIVGFLWLSEKLNILRKPDNMSWTHIFGAALLGGIGFTMSMFIANLGFTQAYIMDLAKLSIIVGSLIAGTIGAFFVYMATKPPVEPAQQPQ